MVARRSCRCVTLSIPSRVDGEDKVGLEIVRTALAEPLHRIASNAGDSGDVTVAKVADLEWGHGYDAANGQYLT